MTIRDSIYRSVITALREHTLAELLDAMGEPLDVAPRPGLAPKRKAKQRPAPRPAPADLTGAIMSALAAGPARTEELRRATGWAPEDIARALASLRVEGAIVTSGKGRGTTHTIAAAPAPVPATEVVQ